MTTHTGKHLIQNFKQDLLQLVHWDTVMLPETYNETLTPVRVDEYWDFTHHPKWAENTLQEQSNSLYLVKIFTDHLATVHPHELLSSGAYMDTVHMLYYMLLDWHRQFLVIHVQSGLIPD